MTQDEFIEMARQVGVNATGNEYWPFFIEELEAFAKLVAEKAAAKEREACAKLADEKLMDTALLMSMPPKSSAAWSIAAAIRARAQA